MSCTSKLFRPHFFSRIPERNLGSSGFLDNLVIVVPLAFLKTFTHLSCFSAKLLNSNHMKSHFYPMKFQYPSPPKAFQDAQTKRRIQEFHPRNSFWRTVILHTWVLSILIKGHVLLLEFNELMFGEFGNPSNAIPTWNPKILSAREES